MPCGLLPGTGVPCPTGNRVTGVSMGRTMLWERPSLGEVRGTGALLQARDDSCPQAA